MLRNYLTVTLRYLRRQKGYTVLNILGLSVGMAACVLILFFIANERQFDSQHSLGDRLYRLNEIQTFGGKAPQHVALSMYPMGPAMQADFPEVEAFTRILGVNNVWQYEDKTLTLDEPIQSDPAFLDLFDFPLLSGDPSQLLRNPDDVILTESAAYAFFGDAPALGKTLRNPNGREAVVRGIMADVPDQSHLQFSAIFSIPPETDENGMQNWGSNWLNTYLLLTPSADVAALEAKFNDFLVRHSGEHMLDLYELYLQPFTDIHLGSMHITHDYRNWKKFDGTYLGVFAILALLVLGIAIINFTNLATAQAAKRAKEIGVRKSMGALQGQLQRQFIGEALVLAVFSGLLAVVLVVFTLPVVESISARDFDLYLLGQPLFWVASIGGVLLVGLLAGGYPAWVISAFQPVLVLKGQGVGKARRSVLRNVLVVGQFAVSIALIVGTLVVVRQLDYMQNRDLGFDMEQVMLVPMSGEANENYRTMKAELEQMPQVQAVTASAQRLGNNMHQTGIRVEGRDQGLGPSHMRVDYGFFAFHGIDIVDGRDFSEEREADQNANSFIINQAMANELGWTDPVGKQMQFGWVDEPGHVVGVADDFNFNSLHHAVEPLVVNVNPETYFSELSIRLDGGDPAETVAAVQALWTSLVSDRPFDYSFLDDHLAELYTSDQQVSRVVRSIALLSIFIACLGLFGLVSIATEQRTREMGIRKALGATEVGLVGLIAKDFAVLVAVAFVVAAPLTYVLMQRWLESFAFRIDIGVGVFLLAGGLALLLAMLTVSYRAIKTARVNPVYALRYE
ncbi:MAG: ABC transporter permease [Rhodothermales bacterium]